MSTTNMVSTSEVATIATFRMSLAARDRLRAYAKSSRLSQGELLRRFIDQLPTPRARKKPNKVTVAIT